MSRLIKRIRVVLVAILSLFALIPYFSMDVKAEDTVSTATNKITIGTVKNTAAMPAVMAKVNAEFTKGNVNVDVKSFDSNSELNDAISQGTVNVATTNLVSYASITNKNKSWKIAGTLPGYSALVANKKYKSVKSLKGKTIAVDKKDNSKQYLKSLLKKNKIELSKVKLVQIDSENDRVDSLKSEKIDAAVLEDPAISNARANGNKVLNHQNYNKNNGNVVIVNNDFAKKNASAIQIVMGVMNNQIKKINNMGNYTMANDALRAFNTSSDATSYMNTKMDLTFKKIHKVKKSDFNKAFKYAKSQKIYKGKINYKSHVLKVRGVK